MDWIRDHLWQTWMSASALFVVAELFSLELYLLGVALGALAGGVAALIGGPLAVQGAVAIGVTLATLLFVRPSMVRKLRQGPELQQGHQRLLGQSGLVLREVTTLNPGLVRLAGDEWTAIPYDETLTLPVGVTVEVFEIRGATAVVHPVTTPEY